MRSIFVNQYTENAKKLLDSSTEVSPKLHVITVYFTDVMTKPYTNTVYFAVYDKKTCKVIESGVNFNEDNYSKYFPLSSTYKKKFGGKVPTRGLRCKLIGSSSTVKFINDTL